MVKEDLGDINLQKKNCDKNKMTRFDLILKIKMIIIVVDEDIFSIKESDGLIDESNKKSF